MHGAWLSVQRCWMLASAALWAGILAGCNQAVSSCTEPGRFRISPDDIAVILGTSFVASAERFQCGNAVPLGERLTWRSLNPAVADVDAVTGRVTAQAGAPRAMLAAA